MKATGRRTDAPASVTADRFEPGPERPASGVLAGWQRTKLMLLRRLLARPATIDELAGMTEVDRTVARRHMADLLVGGFVTAQPVRGGRGRPKTRFAVTPEGREIFFSRYDVLLDCLTRGSVERAGSRPTRTLFGDAATQLSGDLGFPTTTEGAVRALQGVGFEPELRTDRGRRLIISHNCPVLRQARKTPGLVCESFHSTLLGRAFPGSHALLQQTMATGAPECVHMLSPK